MKKSHKESISATLKKINLKEDSKPELPEKVNISLRRIQLIIYSYFVLREKWI